MAIRKEQLTYGTPTPLNISTYTIITDITKNKNEIDLHILSRLIPIYDENSIQTQDQNGCIIGINNYTEHQYSDIPRGKIDIKKKFPNSVFNNQLTILYKYYGFKTVNIKIFNGKLHLTGIKDYPWEVHHSCNYIINMIKSLKYQIYTNIEDFKATKNYNYVLYYDKDINDIVYYRNNINIYNIDDYIKGKKNTRLKWMRSNEVKPIIERYIEQATVIENDMTELHNKIVLTDNYSMDDRTFIYDKLFKYNKLKKIKANVIYYENNKLKQYLTEHIAYLLKIIKKYIARIEQTFYSDEYVISKLKVLYPNIIEECSNLDRITNSILYKTTAMSNKDFVIGNISIDLIKSEFNNGMGHKLVQFSNKLREDKYNIFNTYNPNTGHAGILIKFYYNKIHLDKKPGICHCKEFCINKKKHANKPNKCSCLTIIIFRPANITITGGKTVEEIKYAYEFINKFINDNINDVCYNINPEEINENKIKKIVKKQPLFIKRSNICYD
jgi:TATA-box binding protein (TBP) (component of TFIID and TFIIIB)